MSAKISGQAIVSALRQRLPKLLAIYLFGSRATGQAGADSDLDLAVLVEGKLDILSTWELAQSLADIVGCDVDLIDLRAASTVLQYQVITTGSRLWSKDVQAALYECAILSQKTELDTARAGLLEDIEREGHVYGR
ncbi:type VII toxin-antitoxin system MntA family adenylyltransferase antitoxin [Duganella violaceipulchra]|uniref:Nucleotidyltransferase n=1 Tax=Duganella violaceipulchra TaxID=2849652 RepID=A0AA41HH39_9BURK|nr:nucleotidyltransferase domain-containing protein [Duganella violaceicalia]MBV6324036.1 nucleotidyltransferase domain-containing protein [Duganella violaceicalia]MCP2010981.1 putative nucleotidyltransferase [Duganella violaceicalia]